MSDREKFEAWFLADGWSPLHLELQAGRTAWSAWQASRRAALEDAIAIIESHQVPIGNSAAGEMAAGWTMDALHEIRDAIRALANGDPK